MLIHLPKSKASFVKYRKLSRRIKLIALWEQKKERRQQFWKIVLNMWLFSALMIAFRVSCAMMAIPHGNRGLPVRLPSAESSVLTIHKENIPLISMDDRGRLALNNRFYDLPEFEVAINYVVRKHPNIELKLSIDKQAKMKHVNDILLILVNSGCKKIYFETKSGLR